MALLPPIFGFTECRSVEAPDFRSITALVLTSTENKTRATKMAPFLVANNIRLADEGHHHLIVCGITTNHCCETTARMARKLAH